MSVPPPPVRAPAALHHRRFFACQKPLPFDAYLTRRCRTQALSPRAGTAIAGKPSWSSWTIFEGGDSAGTGNASMRQLQPALRAEGDRGEGALGREGGGVVGVSVQLSLNLCFRATINMQGVS